MNERRLHLKEKFFVRKKIKGRRLEGMNKKKSK